MSTALNRLVARALTATPLTARLVPAIQAIRFKRRGRALYDKYGDATLIPEPLFVENLRLAAPWRSKPGAVVECGVWRGGMIAAMAELLGPTRPYVLFDSFQGLPDADPSLDGAWAVRRLQQASSHPHGRAVATVAEAKATMHRAGVTQPQVRPGWFADTMPGFTPPAPIALLRLDADLFASTLQSLEALYPHLTPGGLLLIDDYYSPWAGCAKAVHTYLAQHQLAERIQQSPGGVAHLIKAGVPDAPEP